MSIPVSTNSTLEYFDGFDDYNTSLLTRYWNINRSASGSPSISVGTGRNSTNSIHVINDSVEIGITLNPQTTRTIGFAFKTASNTVSQSGGGIAVLCSVVDNATEQVSLRMNNSGQLFFARNGTQIPNSSTFASQTVTVGVWCYLEVTFTISPSAGVAKLNMNGATILSLTAQNTQATTNSFANVVTLYNVNGTNNPIGPIDYDDVYIRSDSIMLGDQSVETHFPNANGAAINWTPLTGSNFSEVNESVPDDNTSYVYTSSPQTDLYSFPSLILTSGTIAAVMTILQEAVDTSGVASAAPAYRASSGTIYPGVTQFIGAVAYGPYYDIQGLDPSGPAWTVTTVNAYQYGIERIS